MSKTAMIRVRCLPSVKVKAEKVFRSLGITPSTAITIFYKQVALRKKLPFNITALKK